MLVLLILNYAVKEEFSEMIVLRYNSFLFDVDWIKGLGPSERRDAPHQQKQCIIRLEKFGMFSFTRPANIYIFCNLICVSYPPDSNLVPS